MTELPAGTVTLLLGDVEDSTVLWERRPDDMRTAVAELDELITKAVAAHDGARPVEQGEGDSFVAGFARASDAVACGLDLQRATAGGFLRLRMGVHTGEVELRDERNYMGRTINRAARIRDAGYGGQILLSQTAAEVAREALPDGASLRDLGVLELRGFEVPERVWQLEHPELQSEFPPLRASDRDSANLPVQLTSFVGRVDDIAGVGSLLDGARGVTLTGSGGAGKTRLAIEVAKQRAANHPDGAWFVDLSRYNETEAALAGIAESVGYRRAKAASVDDIAGHLGDRSALVVLDNCEHLIAFAASAADVLLRRCPNITILATSREPLGVAGEVTFRVPSLAESDAMTLFVDRARRARPNFALDESSSPVIAEICHRLDGLPLAVELAAARLRALTPAQILEGLHDRFRLLTGGARTTTARQQTLLASVDWSYGLLLDVERTVLNRLSVFAGGFTMEAAEAVCAHGAVASHHVFDIVLQLVDKSLVNADGDRFHLLETVRQYAASQLVDAGDAAATRARHYHSFAELARTHQPFGASEATYRRVISGEYENIRRALQWAAGQDDHTLLGKLASRLYRYWATGKRLNDGARWHEAVVQREQDDAAKGRAMSRLSVLLFLAGSGTQGHDVMDEGLDLLRQSGDRAALQEALVAAAATVSSEAADELAALADDLDHEWLRGWAEFSRGRWLLGTDPRAAAGHCEAARRIAQRVGDSWLDRQAQLWLAFGGWTGDLRPALVAMEECVESIRSAGDAGTLGPALSFTAMMRQMTGDRRGADVVIQELETLDDEIQVPSQRYWAPLAMGRAFVAAARGEWASSISFLDEWIDAADNEVVPMRVRAVVEALAGDHAEAERHNHESLRIKGPNLGIPISEFPADLAPAICARDTGDWSHAEEAARRAVAELQVRSLSALMYHIVVVVLASVWAGQGRRDDAVRLFAATRADGEGKGLSWDDNALIQAAEAGQVDACREALGEERFAQVWDEGAAMSWDDALAYALRGWGPRDRPVDGWDALTPTERQVAELVAAGATNREVADKLFMSVATVKTHLTRVYSKVGVSSRSQLAAHQRA